MDKPWERGSMLRVLVLLPTYNEAANLEAIVEAILRESADTSDTDVLVIDDNSPDGTGQMADMLQTGHPMRVHVLHRSTKEGLGRAYAAGYAWALASDYDVVAQMDADWSHDPADLPRLITAVAEGADVVIGSRYVPGGQMPGWPWRRRLLSWAGSRYAAALLGLPVRDVTGGVDAFSPRGFVPLGGPPPLGTRLAVQPRAPPPGHPHRLACRERPIY